MVLTEDIKTRRVFGTLPIDVTTFDETAEKVPTAKIISWSKAPGVKLLVCLVGVQTNQFPRAMDMAKIFRAEGITVIMGGFHTSGTINMLSDQEPDIQELYREGICIVSGEVEGKWEDILADYLHDRLKPLYSFAQDLQNLVDIEDAPLPQTSAKTMEHFAYPSFATADTSRGCPFACTFCTIINVQGRKMRERSPQSIAAMMRRNYLDHGLSFYFFTDDNFARKKLWRETFEEIIKLREEGLDVSFMMQVDLAKKPKDFVPLAARAGCTQVFIGMESVNPQNLEAEGKEAEQGRRVPRHYQRMARRRRLGAHGIHHRPAVGFEGASRRGRSLSDGRSRSGSGFVFYADASSRIARSPRNEKARRMDGPGLQQTRLVSCHHRASAHDGGRMDRSL